MQLKIYNSLSGEKEVFKPILEGNIGMYVCGPTVYSNVHLGNVRTFLSFDFIYRSLQFLGYKVRYVRNITDAGHLTDDGDINNDRFIKQFMVYLLQIFLYQGDVLILAEVLAVGDEDLIKIHFHTNEPWQLLEYCSTLGEIYDIVVEDMDRQSRGLKG